MNKVNVGRKPHQISKNALNKTFYNLLLWSKMATAVGPLMRVLFKPQSIRSKNT